MKKAKKNPPKINHFAIAVRKNQTKPRKSMWQEHMLTFECLIVFGSHKLKIRLLRGKKFQ